MLEDTNLLDAPQVIFNSIKRANECEKYPDSILNHLKWTNKPATAKIMKFPEFSLTFLVLKISLTIL